MIKITNKSRNESEAAVEFLKLAIQGVMQLDMQTASLAVNNLLSSYPEKEQEKKIEVIKNNNEVNLSQIQDLKSMLGSGSSGNYYMQYMLPGGVNYERVFKAIDAAHETRLEIAKDFMKRVEHLMKSSADQYGVVAIKHQTHQFHLFDNGKYYNRSSYSINPSGYIDAIRSAYSSPVGVQVGGVSEYNYSEIRATDNVTHMTKSIDREGGVMVYVVPDLMSEGRVELLKVKMFHQIESALVQMRQEVLSGWVKNTEAMNAFLTLFKNTDLKTLKGIFESQQGNLRVVSVSVGKKSVAEILREIPDESILQRNYLLAAKLELEARQKAILDSKLVVSDVNIKAELSDIQEGIDQVVNLLK